MSATMNCKQREEGMEQQKKRAKSIRLEAFWEQLQGSLSEKDCKG